MNINLKDVIQLFLKGLAMGAANVIPGVSGGTIAFITGIYERLFDAIKAFNPASLQLLLKGKLKAFVEKTDLVFLIAVFFGIAVSILSLAKLLEWLFCNYELLTLAFFFGLIIASVYLVGKQIKTWNVSSILFLLVGTAIAVGIGFLKPASANDGFIYLIVCGIVAMASMVLPGLSGSYVLLIMGNYLLVISAVGNLDLKILAPVGIGAVIGLVGFSHLLSFVFKKFHDPTVGLLTGFVLGSLYIIWPWKHTQYKLNSNGDFVDKYGAIITDTCREGIVLGYDRFIPTLNGHFFMALAIMLAGIAVVLLIERLGKAKPSE